MLRSLMIPAASAAALAASVSGFHQSSRMPIAHCSGSSSSRVRDSHPHVHVERFGDITVLYADKPALDKKMVRFVKGGKQKLQVVSDFDFTMSKFHIGDKRGASCHRLIEGSGFLPNHLVRQADALFNYYYPLEIDPVLPMNEKIEYMTQWASKAAELMVESGLKKTEIRLAVSEALKAKTFCLRDEVPQFLQTLSDNGVPLLLFSAGIGDIIEETLTQVLGKVPDDVHVVSNHMVFQDDKLVSWTSPVFHVFNKKASSALHSPFFTKYDLAHRDNVMLIGDSIGDVRMSDGLPCHPDSVLRIGFLNDKVERLPDYLAIYDVVILGDPSFALVNSLLGPIIGA